MSRQTINALQRFTHDLMKRADNTLQRFMDDAAKRYETSGLKKHVTDAYGTATKITNDMLTTPKPGGIDSEEPSMHNESRARNNKQPAKPPGAAKAPPTAPAKAIGQVNEGRVPGKNEPNTADPSLGGGIDPQVLRALLGGGAGALAGYGLGSAFQDEDDDSQPWLSTLAGTAAGGVGLPLLMQYLSQQGAPPLPPGAVPPAPAPAPAPPKTI